MASVLQHIKPSDLPAPPEAALALLRACADPEVSDVYLASIVEKDPLLSLEILRIVNSAFYGLGHEVSNLQRAITLIGHRALRNLVLCVSIRETLAPVLARDFDVAAYWEDALRRAVAARGIAGWSRINPEEAFTAGLLQDFGLLVLFHLNPDCDVSWKELAQLDPEQRLEQERARFGSSHDEVVQLMAREWSLPETLGSALGGHHHCDVAESGHSLCRILHCADWLAAVFSSRERGRVLQQARLRVASLHGGLESGLDDLLQSIPTQVEQAAEMLALHVHEQVDFDDLIRDANLQLAEQNLSFQDLTWRLEKAIQERDALAAELNRELELAAEIQRSLLPAGKDHRFPIHAVNLPAKELSGDFYDYYTVEDGTIYFSLGDVSGKGITAALLMAKTCSLFRCLGKHESDLGRLMSILNEEIHETSVRGMFVAMIAGQYFPRTGRLRLVNAGNPPVLLLDKKNGIESLSANAPPLGILPQQAYPVIERELHGGGLLCCSDGVTEGFTEQGDMLGMQGLMEIARRSCACTPQALFDRILSSLRKSGPQRDDITLLLIDDRKPLGELRLRQEFLSQPVQLQEMRQVLQATLQQIHCRSSARHPIIIAVNEACMNIMQHAYQGKPDGRIIIELYVDECDVVIRLIDYAQPVDRTCIKARDLREIRPGGLGVHFINEIMDDVCFVDDCEGAGNILVMRKQCWEK